MQPERAQFVGIFKEEAAEHIQYLHRGLLALKSDPGDETVLQETARAADTLLGSAMTMGFEEVSQYTRTMRDRLFSARDGRSPLDVETFEMLLRSLETLCACIDTAVMQVQGDGAVTLPFVTVMAMRACLEQLHHEMTRLPEHSGDATTVNHVRLLSHTLHEHSRAVGLDAIAQVTQRIEDILRIAEEDRLTIHSDELGLLIQTIGCIEILLDAAATGEDSGLEIDELCVLLDEMLSQEVSEAVGTVASISDDRPVEAGEEKPQGTSDTGHEARERQEIHMPVDIVRETVKVLIASNSTLFSRKLSHVLSQAKYEVILASNVDEVVSHLEHKDIDLCFVRDSLPKSLEICEHFARHAEVDHAIPIIVYSTQSRMQQSVLERGAAGFLKVPCQPQDVLAVVDRFRSKKPQLP